MAAGGINPDAGLGWISRLWPVVTRQRIAFARGVAAGLAATAAAVAVPPVIGRGVDAVASGTDVRPHVTALVVLATARFALGFAYRFELFRSAHRIEADLRDLVFERLTELSFSYWDRVQTAQVISRANSDVRSIQLLFAFGPLVAMQLVLLAAGAAAMLALSPQLSLVALAPLPLVLLLGTRLRDRVFPLSWVAQARTADLATIVDENIQGAQIVRDFAQERNQVRLLARCAQRLRWAGVATFDARARHAPLMAALPRVGMALVLLVGGLAAIDGSVAVGDIVAFNAYVLIMAAPFRMIGFVMVQWQRAKAAAQRVFELIDERPDIAERRDAVRMTSPMGRVEFDDVVFTYPAGDGNPVLKGLTITVEAGETVAVVGATGCGKSTIARLLPRFYDPDSGSVRLDGIDVKRLRLSDLRRAVAVVTEDPFLFALSVRDNVALARPDADDATVAAALADAAATDFTEALADGAQTDIGERGATVSGGQRQRLAIARALVADPAVLVLDDATSSIDAEIERRIHEALQRRRCGRTTILIAHRLSTIALAERVVFLADGTAAAVGSHAELLRTVPEYTAVLADLSAESAEQRRVPAHSTLSAHAGTS